MELIFIHREVNADRHFARPRKIYGCFAEKIKWGEELKKKKYETRTMRRRVSVRIVAIISIFIEEYTGHAS